MDIKKKKCLISFGAVFLSSLIMAFATKNLVRPAGILSGGFMGIAIMIDMIAELIGHNIPTSIGLLCLNIPVALFCAKKISPRFVFFSLLQVGLTSLFLPLMPQVPLFDDKILNVIFGGFMFGGSIVIALKGNASSGGTDFIALYVSNKSGKEIWNFDKKSGQTHSWPPEHLPQRALCSHATPPHWHPRWFYLEQLHTGNTPMCFIW